MASNLSAQQAVNTMSGGNDPKAQYDRYLEQEP